MEYKSSEEWESDDISNWESDDIEDKNIKSRINKNIGNYSKKDVNIEIEEYYNLIKIDINIFKKVFEIFTNVKLNILNIKIFFNDNLKVTKLKLLNKGIDELTSTDYLILSKLNKIITNLKIDLEKEFILEIMDNIVSYISNDIYNCCYICNNVGVADNILNNKLVFNLCGSLLCITNSFISQKYIVEEEIKENSDRFEFMLYLFIFSCYVNRIPCILPKDTDLNKVMEILSTLPSIESIKNEKNLKKILTNDLYSILSWLIFTYLNKINLFEKSYKQIIFNINESFEKKKEFKSVCKKDTLNIFKMYHGSSDYNYFNIIMNGLKNFSKTKYQTNGCAYGNGVYFGKMEVANGYNRKIVKKIKTSNFFFLNVSNEKYKKVEKLIFNSKYYKLSKILKCEIYYENPQWHRDHFCTVIPKNENILIKSMIINI